MGDKDAASPPSPKGRGRIRDDRGKQSAPPRGGRWEGPPLVTERPCMAKSSGEQSSLPRGGHLGGPHRVKDKSPVSPPIPMGSSPAPNDESFASSSIRGGH